MSEERTPRENPMDGDDPMQARLRRALSARADLVTNRDLAQWAMPEPTPPNRTPWYVAAASVAAAVLAAVALSLTGWNPFGSGGSSGPAAQGDGASTSAAGPAPSGGATPAGGASGGTASAAAPTPSGQPTPSGGAQASAGATSSPATSPSGQVAVCTPAGVSAFVLPDTDARPHGGGMNHQGATIGVTNVGATPCRIYGYLGVGLYNGDTLESAPTTLRGDTGYAKDPGASSIVLAPGSSAYTELGWSSADGTKPATEVTQVRVILPDQKQQLTIAFTSVIGGAARELFQTALTPAPLPLNG